MAGSLSIAIQRGRGTLIEVTIQCELPRHKKPQLSGFARTNSHVTSLELNAIIVEDMPFNADLIETYLNNNNNIIVRKRAINGEKAVQFYKELFYNNCPIDIITMDLECL